MKKCNTCNKEEEIVNKHFGLCRKCNNKRLHGSEFGKTYKFTPKPSKLRRGALKPAQGKLSTRKKPMGKNLLLDEEFYEKCFNASNHKCEECGKQLPDEFRGDDGKVIARWRYSHIIPKSIAPELRHEIENINHLCLEHHSKWENGDKKSMRIYDGNVLRLPKYF
tara:strand:- start:7744 stop:8238 length:495 start_codon:yes stop_codon:yes gene_type:complete